MLIWAYMKSWDNLVASCLFIIMSKLLFISVLDSWHILQVFNMTSNVLLKVLIIQNHHFTQV